MRSNRPRVYVYPRQNAPTALGLLWSRFRCSPVTAGNLGIISIIGPMRDAGYREAVVAYLDILGFRKLIETSATDPSHVSTILNALRELKDRSFGGGRVI